MSTPIQETIPQVRIPASTYRLQFNWQFTFQEAKELVDYLDELGITDCYASPLFKCQSKSTHCYDVTDPNQLNPELGTEEDFLLFSKELKNRGMGLLLDIVPNHMSIISDNRWWDDVLKTGTLFSLC